MLRYYITDRHGCPDLLGCIERAAKAGVDWIQIREKDLSTRDLLRLTKDALDVARRHGAKVLVNGRVDVALAAGADGVHLPSESVVPETWRAIVPPGFLIGVSCHSLKELKAAEAADFAVFGPVFSSPGKGSGIGRDGLSQAVAAARVPLIALGGIDEGNAEECIRMGAAGVAGIRMFQRF